MTVTVRPKLASIAPYKQIENDIRRRIEGGEWAEGMMIPSRRALAEEYNVELPTVQRAVAGLLKTEMLRADGGRGTFVSWRPAPSSLTRWPAGQEARQPDAQAGRARSGPRIGIISSLRAVHADGTVDENVWSAIIVHALERFVAAEGGSSSYANLVGWLGDDANLALAARNLIQGGVDGIVLALPRGGSIYHKYMAEFSALGVPVVYIGASDERLPITQVYYDDRDGGQHAALHLLDQGAKRIDYLLPASFYWAEARLEGCREALAFRGLDPDFLSVHRGNLKVREMRDEEFEQLAYGYAVDLIASGLRPEAVVAPNDLTAYAFVRAASEANWRMGSDYMIVGFDDDARSREIGLTSMQVPLETAAKEAMRLMGDLLAGARSCGRVCLHFDLIARKSTHA